MHKEYFLFEKTWDDVFGISMLSLVYLWEVVFGVFNHFLFQIVYLDDSTRILFYLCTEYC